MLYCLLFLLFAIAFCVLHCKHLKIEPLLFCLFYCILCLFFSCDDSCLESYVFSVLCIVSCLLYTVNIMLLLQSYKNTRTEISNPHVFVVVWFFYLLWFCSVISIFTFVHSCFVSNVKCCFVYNIMFECVGLCWNCVNVNVFALCISFLYNIRRVCVIYT